MKNKKYDRGFVEPSIKTVSLRLHKICTEMGIDWINMNLVDIESFTDNCIKCMILRLRAGIYGETLKKVEISYPQDWWQHFKQRWFPKWAKDKWPVIMKTETVEATALYPMVSLPDKKHVIQVVKISEDEQSCQ